MNALSGLQLKTDPGVQRATQQVAMAESRLTRCQQVCAKETSGGRKLHSAIANALRVYQDDLVRHQAALREAEHVALQRLATQSATAPPAPGTHLDVIDDDGEVRINGLRLS